MVPPRRDEDACTPPSTHRHPPPNKCEKDKTIAFVRHVPLDVFFPVLRDDVGEGAGFEAARTGGRVGCKNTGETRMLGEWRLEAHKTVPSADTVVQRKAWGTAHLWSSHTF